MNPNLSSKALIDVLHEDDHFMVFDKPAGLLVIPTPKNEQKTLVNIVNRQYADEDNSSKLHPCHRIDRDTSGAIIFAKGKRNQKLMMDLFKQHAVEKTYIAFVHGTLPSKQGQFRKPVKDIHQRKFQKRSPAKPAITSYKVVATRNNFSIVEVQPVTGRTNQIRIHFSQAKHPLLGDRKYAFPRDYVLKFRRTALHAAALKWTHPVSHKTISVRSKLPKDMSKFINEAHTYGDKMKTGST